MSSLLSRCQFCAISTAHYQGQLTDEGRYGKHALVFIFLEGWGTILITTSKSAALLSSCPFDFVNMNSLRLRMVRLTILQLYDDPKLIRIQ